MDDDGSCTESQRHVPDCVNFKGRKTTFLTYPELCGLRPVNHTQSCVLRVRLNHVFTGRSESRASEPRLFFMNRRCVSSKELSFT